MNTIYYKNWLTQEGNGILVNKIEFLGYVKSSNSYLLERKHKNKIYQCELWKLENEFGDEFEGRFRVLKDTFLRHHAANHSDYKFSFNAIPDDTPNPITDSFEEVMSGKLKTYKKEQMGEDTLIFFKKAAIALGKNLNKGLRQALKVRMNFENSPTMNTAKAWNKLPKPQRKALFNILNAIKIEV